MDSSVPPRARSPGLPGRGCLRSNLPVGWGLLRARHRAGYLSSPRKRPPRLRPPARLAVRAGTPSPPPALWNFNAGDSWVPHPDPSPHHQRSCHGTRDAPPDSRQLTNSRPYVYRRTVDPRHTTWITCGRKTRTFPTVPDKNRLTISVPRHPPDTARLVRARLPARAPPGCPAVTFPWGPESTVPAAPCPPVSTPQRGPRPPVPLRRVSRPVPALPALSPVATHPSPAREVPSAQLLRQTPTALP
jgi:hypothetical protein